MAGLKIFYHVDTGKCPRCKSMRTGRIVYGVPVEQDKWREELALRHGEYIITESCERWKGAPNLFCLDCESTWVGRINKRWVTKEELKKIQEEKQITKGIVKGSQIERKEAEKEKTYTARMKRKGKRYVSEIFQNPVWHIKEKIKRKEEKNDEHRSDRRED